MSLAPGWYTSENDTTRERYWNGSRWQEGTRPAQGAPAVELAVVAPPGAAPTSSSSSKLRETGDLLLGLAVLVALGSIIIGGILIAQTDSGCDGAQSCDSMTHPYVGAAIVTIIGGLLQAVVFLVLGQLARGLHDVREAVVTR